jgi:hypothetical protein
MKQQESKVPNWFYLFGSVCVIAGATTTAGWLFLIGTALIIAGWRGASVVIEVEKEDKDELV